MSHRVACRDSLRYRVAFRDRLRPRIVFRDKLSPRVAFRDRLQKFTQNRLHKSFKRYLFDNRSSVRTK